MVHTIVCPSRANFVNNFIKCLDEELSKPLERGQRFVRRLDCVGYSTYEVGSSKNSTGGLSSNSKATESRFRWPPES